MSKSPFYLSIFIPPMKRRGVRLHEGIEWQISDHTIRTRCAKTGAKIMRNSRFRHGVEHWFDLARELTGGAE
jgi:hypothetical protein